MKLAFQLIGLWVAFSCVVGPLLTWWFFRGARLARDRETEMGKPYQVKVGGVIAIVVDERRALEMVRKFPRMENKETVVKDVFGSEVDVAALESRMREAENAIALK